MLTCSARLILSNTDGELLFLLQTKKNGGKYSLVGGTVERSEFSRATLCREALEEVGIRINPEDLNLVHTQHRHLSKKGNAIISLFFIVETYYGVPSSKEPKKFVEVEWLDPNKLPENISPFTRQAVDSIIAGSPYSEFTDRIIEKPKNLKDLTDYKGFL